MKLYYALQSDAQAEADYIHSWMQSHDAGYAQSVAAGDTVRWCVPQKDVDALGNVITTSRWYVTVLDRCMGALSPTEQAALVP